MLIMKLPNTVGVKCCSSFTSAANISLVLSHLKLKIENMPNKKERKQLCKPNSTIVVHLYTLLTENLFCPLDK